MSNIAEQKQINAELLKRMGITGQAAMDAFIDVQLERVDVSVKRSECTVRLRTQTLIAPECHAQFAERLKGLLGIETVYAQIVYPEQVSDENLIGTYWDTMLDWLGESYAIMPGSLRTMTWKIADQQLHLMFPNEVMLDAIKKKRIDSAIGLFIERYFDRQISVHLGYQEDAQTLINEMVLQREQEDRLHAEEAMQAAIASANASESRTEGRPSGGEVKYDRPRRSFGNPIRDAATPISQIQDEERRVTIEGCVFDCEIRELRSGRTLITFHVTDYTDSLGVRYFLGNKEDVERAATLKNDAWVRVRGAVQYDTYSRELSMLAQDIQEIPPLNERLDDIAEKRVEFHAHTNMSTMDATPSAEELVGLAAKWGHRAVAITDHNGVQSFPKAYSVAKKLGIKVLYGMEASVVNDAVPLVMNAKDQASLGATYVVFDVETTGLSVANCKIIELAGVKMRDGTVIDRFERFVNPHQRIPENITRLTSITDEMVAGAPEQAEVLKAFIDFVDDAVLVAHNARFDMGFVQAGCKVEGLPSLTNTVVDTLELARFLLPTLKNHRLDTLTGHYKISLQNHHRAVDDAEATANVLWNLLKGAADKGVKALGDFNNYVGVDLKNQRPFHCTVYALNQIGKKNLFKLVSLSHTDYLLKTPRIPKSLLDSYREGLLIASGCEKGELFESVLNKSYEEALEVAEFYDVLEIQPIGFSMYQVDRGFVGSVDLLREAVQTICRIGEELEKPVIATGNVHYLHPNQKIFRDILIHGITGYSPLKDMKEKPDAHFRTTQEMLDEFAFLGEEKAYEAVVKNTQQLADRFDEIQVFPNQLFSPSFEGADEEIRALCYERAHVLYGPTLPDVVTARLEKELAPIVKFGFSANYLYTRLLVKKSLDDGYLVGSRGSVGSSFVATMLNITEVNPLPPHYRCETCGISEFFAQGESRSGYDLPRKNCPNCGKAYACDGHDIPFETFLGFKGDKVPDIDLNFSPQYQALAHEYTKVLFGEENVFRGGTIGTVADKTAFGYVKKYSEDHETTWRNAEQKRLANGCTGARRTTGQHPGGIIVVPSDIDIEEITPIQYPADDKTASWKTTHFDYHAFEENLTKLDILGHGDPTMMRMLHDLTGVDPLAIPMDDPQVMSLFNSTTSLGLTPEQIRSEVASYGFPDMGTPLARSVLYESQPRCFADLVQISGLTHGTGVWNGNAQALIKAGTCTIENVIGCRDDIMLYLISKGMEPALAYMITESIRKGRGLKDEWIEAMKQHDVPQWYIDSCLKIEYMFPKAHAVSYVTFAVRTAYYKMHHPLEFYCAYFTVRGDEMELEVMIKGHGAILKRLDEIESKGFDATNKERNSVTTLQMAAEMTARGFHFKSIDLYKSEAERFVIEDKGLIPPFSVLSGIGANAAHKMVEARADGEFMSIEDFQNRSRAGSAVVDALTDLGCFNGLPESNQLSLFA